MLYILISKTRPDLTQEEYTELGKRAKQFYNQVPEGIKLCGDWAANDQSRTFSLIETDDLALLEEIQSPFQGYVDIEMIPVTAVSTWRPS